MTYGLEIRCSNPAELWGRRLMGVVNATGRGLSSAGGDFLTSAISKVLESSIFTWLRGTVL